jgi:predicted MPP superfamily phosphohydrolase|tara:strand:+ start:563 stop:1804 length:1242 start_codon:yes stop_codon:yes gene_type:complete
MKPTSLLIPIVVMLLIVSIIEWMAFRLVKRRWDEKKWWPMFGLLWLIISVSLWVCVTISLINFESWSARMPSIVGIFTIAFFVNLIPKIVMAIFQVTDDLRYLTQFTMKKITRGERGIPRSTFLNYIGAGLASLTFGAMFYAVTKGKYDYRVEKIKVLIDGLPDTFKGLRIVQISDAHLGSFVGEPQAVLDALQTVNDLKPDLILFTGDLVNSKASEAESWIDAFSKLEAPMGKYSIMGNHDYAEYGDFAPGESEASVKRLQEIHEEMGFRLLLDEHVHLKRAEDRLVLAGVENWSKRAFGKRGDIEKALANSDSDSLTTILMSHDPTHFEELVMGGKAPVDLTVSGHTHGMQMGIKIDFLGINYSPASMLYKRWGGLYKEGNQFLHVNRGFGVLAFRGRVGMPPEITLLELL